MKSSPLSRRESLFLVATVGLGGLIGACQSSTVKTSNLPPAALSEITALIKSMGGHDLETEDLGSYPVAGWERLPTRLYAYHKTDPDGTKKRGLAVMLNPDAEQVARWIVQAIMEVKGAYDPALARKLARETRDASGFQFLVRGVHWEKMGTAPVHVAYPFRDGVTVKLRRFGDSYPTHVLSEADLRYTLECGEDEVTQTGKFARIQSTTREHYKANGGPRETAGHLWRPVVKELYKVAWGNDRNELMVAKARFL